MHVDPPDHWLRINSRGPTFCWHSKWVQGRVNRHTRAMLQIGVLSRLWVVCYLAVPIGHVKVWGAERLQRGGDDTLEGQVGGVVRQGGCLTDLAGCAVCWAPGGHVSCGVHPGGLHVACPACWVVEGLQVRDEGAGGDDAGMVLEVL